MVLGFTDLLWVYRWNRMLGLSDDLFVMGQEVSARAVFTLILTLTLTLALTLTLTQAFMTEAHLFEMDTPRC